jgi:6-phosphogluconolactonase
MGTMRLLLLMGLCTVCLTAQASFLYTNNDIPVVNRISGFSITATGALVPIAGSPWLTGGAGRGGGLFASNRVTSAIVKDFLYASNGNSHNISAFSINPATGVLTAVPGSPFAVAGAASDISLGATPDGKFLFAANSLSSNISAFSIAANGALTPVAGSPFAVAGEPDGIKVTPADGRFLAVADVFGNKVAMFNVTATGGLIPVAGSPFPAPGPGVAASVDCNCAQDHLFVGAATFGVQVDVFSIAPSGALSSIAGSPFSGPGTNSNVAVLSPDDTKLFVSNQFSFTVDVFSVAASGALTLVAGSPFPAAGAIFPSGLAIDAAGRWLYAGDANNLISGFSIGPTGALTAVPGSPFGTGAPGGTPLSLTVFPPKTCCPSPTISDVSATPNVLWPPNHKFVDVTIGYSVTDPCPNTCVLTVASSEPVNGTGDGNTSPDWQVIDSHHVSLRAERSGPGEGRVYTITITCTNATNHLSSTKTVTVLVPHDQGH